MNRIGLAITLAIAATVGVAFAVWPELDLKLAGVFFDAQRGGFWRGRDPLYLLARDASTWLTVLVAAPAALALAVKFALPYRPLLMPARAVVLMLVTLALAPGALTFALKEHWARPRPGPVAEFGGIEHFRPWWDPRGDCETNCSFIAGEPTGAFWTMAAAAVAPPQWRALGYAAALAFGSAVGFLRIATGSHFFSDVVAAGVLTFLVIWVAHGCLYRWKPTRTSDEAVEKALQRLARPLGSLQTNSTRT